MTKQIVDFKLVDKQDYCRSVLLRLRAERALPSITPGQFVQVRFLTLTHFSASIYNKLIINCFKK